MLGFIFLNILGALITAFFLWVAMQPTSAGLNPEKNTLIRD